MEKILVSVMTYPSLSEKHFETVCTAGFREDGSWVRIFPVPHRLMRLQEENKSYSKWQWIETELVHRPERDDRPESFRIKDIDNIILGPIIEVKNNKQGWHERWRYVQMGENKIYTDMSQLIALANENKLSLAVLKPTKVADVVCERYSQEAMAKFKSKQLELQKRYEASQQQLSLFDDQNHLNEHFRFAEKIPYKFSYKFTTDDGQWRTLMIEDWELGALYRNCMKSYGDEKIACQKVREKYVGFIQKNDLYLFLGTTYQWQKKKVPNPFVIIGVFAPPKGVVNQQQLAFEF